MANRTTCVEPFQSVTWQQTQKKEIEDTPAGLEDAFRHDLWLPVFKEVRNLSIATVRSPSTQVRMGPL